MLIKKLTVSVLKPVTAIVVKNKNKNKNNELYFNIKHGGRGENLFTYTIGLDKHMFKPNATEDTLVMEDKDYILLPIYKNGMPMRDSRNNYMYYISKDQVDDHTTDYILLWEIPNKFYTDVTYTLKGNVKEIGIGINGRSRTNEIFKSPAPILEIFGNCELNWTAIDSTKRYAQKITLEDNAWNIGKLEVTDHTYGDNTEEQTY